MRRPPIRNGPTTGSAVRCARAASSSAAPPPQRQRALARLRRVTRGACLALEAAAGTSHHDRAPKERGLSPAQPPRIGYRPTLASAAQRAHRSSRAAPPPKGQRAHAPAPREKRSTCLALETVAGTSHHGRALKERGLSPAQRPRIGYGPTLASAAQCAHRKLACCASSQGAASACAGAARETQR